MRIRVRSAPLSRSRLVLLPPTFLPVIGPLRCDRGCRTQPPTCDAARAISGIGSNEVAFVRAAKARPRSRSRKAGPECLLPTIRLRQVDKKTALRGRFALRRFTAYSAGDEVSMLL